MRLPKNRVPTHPGEVLLEEFVRPLGISQTELAKWIGVSYPRLNEIINGKRGIAPDTALRLQQVFGADAQFWLNLQLVWDLYHAKHSESAREIERNSSAPGTPRRAIGDSEGAVHEDSLINRAS